MMAQPADSRSNQDTGAAADMSQPRQFLRSVTGRKMRDSFESVVGARIGKLVDRIRSGGKPASDDSLLDYAAALLSLRGRASGAALASAFFDRYEASDMAARHVFLTQLHAQNPRNPDLIDQPQPT